MFTTCLQKSPTKILTPCWVRENTKPSLVVFEFGASCSPLSWRWTERQVPYLFNEQPESWGQDSFLRGGRSMTSSNLGLQKLFPSKQNWKVYLILPTCFHLLYFSLAISLGIFFWYFSPLCFTLHCLWIHGPKTQKSLMSAFLFSVFQESLIMALQSKYIL